MGCASCPRVPLRGWRPLQGAPGLFLRDVCGPHGLCVKPPPVSAPPESCPQQMANGARPLPRLEARPLPPSVLILLSTPA